MENIPSRNREMATVNPDFTRVVADTYFSDRLAQLDCASIARLQRMMCNNGMEVIGDTSPALHTVMGVNRGDNEPTLRFNNRYGERAKWKRRVELSPEDQAWEDQFTTTSAALVVPESGVDTGLKVNFSNTPPELAIFAELPQSKAINAAGRLACRQMDENLDPAPYLDQVERWWGFPNGMLGSAINKTAMPISVPRLLAAGGKSASPIYGVENYSGYVRFIEPSATRLSFETKDDLARGNEIAVDFSYYRACIRWVVSTALQLPGRGRAAIERHDGVIGFNINSRGRVVVPPKAMEFAIPTLQLEAKAVETKLAKETARALERAADGRTAVIAGIILGEGELLLSQKTRERMGHLRTGKAIKRHQGDDVKVPLHHAEVWHAQAGVGLGDFCITMLGSDLDHLARCGTAMGKLSVLVQEKKLNCSVDHCITLSCLWHAAFKNSFQRACIQNGSTMDDFVSNSPESYPYDAKIAYAILRNQIKQVLRRIESLEVMFGKKQTNPTPYASTIREARSVISAWAEFYAGKAKSATKKHHKVRAQILSAFYAGALIEGDVIDFPELHPFLEASIYKYARRQNKEQLTFTNFENVDHLVQAADGEYNPEVHFTYILRSLRNARRWTLTDLMEKSPAMEHEDHNALDDDDAEEYGDDEGDDPSELEGLIDMSMFEAKEEMLERNMRGALALRAKFYAVCMTAGSEQDFIKRVLKKNYATFAEWHAAEPDLEATDITAECESYVNGVANGNGEDDGEEDVL